MNRRKATVSDIPMVRHLWNEVFGDSNDYINRFITRFGIENCYVCEYNSEIVAMAFAIPVFLKFPSNFEGVPEGRGSLYVHHNSKYLYACATHPSFREQGIMGKLLEVIYEDACSENITEIFLHAANDFLANYYRKLGFRDFFYRSHSFYYNHKVEEESAKNTKSNLPDSNPYELCENPLLPLQLNIISPKIYQKKRVQKFENHCFVNWNEDFFQFLNETGTLFCEYENTVFSFRTVINNIIVDELLGDASHEQIAHLLLAHLPDFEVVHIRYEGNDFCCGQIKWCNQTTNHQEKGWFAFAME
jgi:predicted acetyltransferase